MAILGQVKFLNVPMLDFFRFSKSVRQPILAMYENILSQGHLSTIINVEDNFTIQMNVIDRKAKFIDMGLV